MKKFEVGSNYQCEPKVLTNRRGKTVEIVKRNKTTVEILVKNEFKIIRSGRVKLYSIGDTEFIYPMGRKMLSPVCKAKNKIEEEIK